MGSMRIEHRWVWVLMGLLLWSTLHIVADDVKVPGYWESVLHGSPMPASIRAMVTPLNSHQTAQFVIDINATNGFLPTHAAYFCTAAHIQCYQLQDIILKDENSPKLTSDQEISIYHNEPMPDQAEVSVYHAEPSSEVSIYHNEPIPDQLAEVSVYHAEPTSEVSRYHSEPIPDQAEVSVYHAKPTSDKYHIKQVRDQDFAVYHVKPNLAHDHTSTLDKGATVYRTKLSWPKQEDHTKRVYWGRLTNPISQKTSSHFAKPTGRVLTSKLATHRAIFFREQQTLVRSAEIQIHVLSGDNDDIVDKRAFLPRELAQLFPFTSEGLPTIASMLGVSEEALQRTMAHCNTKNDIMIGETRACVTSIEDLADFASSTMGSTKRIKVSEATSDLGMRLAGRKFIVLNVTTLNDDVNDSFISCHDLYFPFRVFFCHKTKQTKYFSVTLQAKDGSRSMHDRVAICHYDTSYWDPNHLSFSELHTKPGQTEACHWMGKNNWVFMYG